MNPNEISALVRQKFAKSDFPEPRLSAEDSQRIESYFGCSLPEEFCVVRALIGIYRIRGATCLRTR
jgi:hypothetical protein